MSLQMVMKIEGIMGESKTYKYKGWSEILSWNWGMTSNRKSVQKASNGNGSTTSLNEISVIKPIGIDSPGIRSLFARAEIIPNIKIAIYPVVGKREAQSRYLDIEFESATIKSIVTGGGIDDNFFKEHITILFDRICFEYARKSELIEENTDIPGAHHAFAWSVQENAEWSR